MVEAELEEVAAYVAARARRLDLSAPAVPGAREAGSGVRRVARLERALEQAATPGRGSCWTAG